MFDVGTCLVFGLIGWMFKKFNYPSSPLVLGLVLGKLIETNYVQTLQVTGPVGFVQRPMTVILFVISIAALAYPIVIAQVHARKAAKLQLLEQQDLQGAPEPEEPSDDED